MSARIEWLDSRYTSAEVVPAGAVIGSEDEVPEGQLGLILYYDEVVVISGTPDRLATLLRRALAAVETTMPDDPIPADYRGEDDNYDDEEN